MNNCSILIWKEKSRASGNWQKTEKKQNLNLMMMIFQESQCTLRNWGTRKANVGLETVEQAFRPPAHHCSWVTDPPPANATGLSYGERNMWKTRAVCDNFYTAQSFPSRLVAWHYPVDRRLQILLWWSQPALARGWKILSCRLLVTPCAKAHSRQALSLHTELPISAFANSLGKEARITRQQKRYSQTAQSQQTEK